MIPETWIWCRLEDIAQSDLGKTLDKAKNKGIYRPYLRSVNIRWGSIDLNDLNQMKFEDEEIPRYTIQKNDLLICEGGEAGRCAVWAYEDSILYQNAIHRIRFHKLIHPYFYLYVIWLYNDINLLDEFTKGVTIKHLTKSALNNIPFPLPPMNEQIKIVDIIENLFSILKSIVDEL
ncbi:MAG: hypothetical protein BGO34_02220 [Bacteroidia bacterium 44-10]|nr:MAG: hypothetical protein BGO34_02220 [Bacteroidia bacterium 44-10]